MITFLSVIGVFALVMLGSAFFLLAVNSAIEAVTTFVETRVLHAERDEYALPLWMPIVGTVVGAIGLAGVIAGGIAWNDAVWDGCDHSHPCVKVVR